MKIYKNVSKVIIVLISYCCVACSQSALDKLVILHTNDTHSQVEPLEVGKRDSNYGGYARRMGLIRQIREANPNILLFDAGDFSQGTPYFNFFKGRIEVDAMNRMGYDAVMLGNHEFDNGVDTLAAALRNANFAVVCTNYDVSGSSLEGIVKPYVVLRRENLRIGVLGIGINPAGLIFERNFTPLVYLDPIEVAQKTADMLKYNEYCDVIVCLSHQGTYQADTKLAQSTRNIDIIIGAHTHKIVTNHYVLNLDGDSVFLAQMGKAGARIGKIEIEIAE